MGSQPPAATATTHHAALFSAPGRPRPLARRLAIHNRVVRAVRRFLEEEGFNEIPVPALAATGGACEPVDPVFSVDHCGHLAFPRQSGQLELEHMVARGFPAVWCETESLRREWKADERHLTGFKLIEAERRDLDLDGLCALQARLLKTVTGQLGADLLGGRHITRLDRMLALDIPRITYREALDILNDRGWSMPFGEDLHRDAEATLSRYFDLRPFQVTHLPAALKPFNLRRDPGDPALCLGVELILPWAGETMDGGVREPDAGRLQEQLDASEAYGQLLAKSEAFAARQVAARAPGAAGPDAATLAARHRAAIRAAHADHLAPFAGQRVARAGFGLGVARLLQYVQGLESIRDAVIRPLDRNSFGAAGAPGAEAADHGTGTA